MDNNIYKKAIECLPMFFDIQLQANSNGKEIFEPICKIINFDEAYIFFLNPDSINLRYIFGKNEQYKVGDEFQIDEIIKYDLFSPPNMLLYPESELIRLLNFKNSNSFLILKLIIKNTVFGFVLLGKTEKDFYTHEDIEVSKSISAVISYKIKDNELSDIFKTQVKALAENVIETKSLDKIKTEFLANISHELRTPLNAIIGFSEILSEQLFGKLNEKQLEYVNDIYISGIHLLGMINELLDISKIEAKAMTLNITEFLLSQAVEEVVNIIKPLADKKKITIEKKINDISVFADFQKIRQILYNLFSNAIKFSPEKDKIEINVFFDKENFIIEIKNNGIGIALQDQKRIFEKFVQLENAYTKKESSTGLGLTITKELVEMHKGKIALKSSLNKGATFIVTIPLNK
jgi:signal transduction histidine kinase